MVGRVDEKILVFGLILAAAVFALAILRLVRTKKMNKILRFERGVEMVTLLIHLPPATDDIQGGGRDERDVAEEAISGAQIMYSILASTFEKGRKARRFGQEQFAFEVVAKDGFVKFYVATPKDKVEIVRQAVQSAYPTARLEKVRNENIFSKEAGINGVAGGELILKDNAVLPINTYESAKRDGNLALLNAMSTTKKGEGVALQILVRPTDGSWTKNTTDWIKNLRESKKESKGGGTQITIVQDFLEAPFRVPDMHEKTEKQEVEKPLTEIEQIKIAAAEEKIRFPGFETAVRLVASAENRARAEALAGGVVAAFAQFDAPNLNGFKYDILKDVSKLSSDYILRFFPRKNCTNILNSVELASLFHLPTQNAIPTSQVERQAIKQVDGPAKLVDEGILLGINEFRGEQKQIRLSENDRRRHTYIIGATGMGKSVLMGNLAYQDMMDGRGFAFIDPHGDVVEDILSKVPPERIDDVIYFDPGDMENPIGMNMFEFDSEDQKDFIVQEGINMLQSLFDPSNQGFFGPRGQHMFRNAALLLMSDPNGATFIDVPKCFVDPEFVKEKLQYVTDRSVYDYWTKEFPASQKSNDAGEVITWFASKWGPFLSNTMMRNVLGQVKSGFDIREIMDDQKILLVNLSKGKMGEINSKLLGMIFVMKFQTAAMSRVNIPEEQRKDFCLYVDEFQNFSTESFESILSEARKFRLNLVVANQFVTQLTDKIREGILGNVGTFIAGRLGVTDAELLEKVFEPVFNAEDLHKLPNHHAVASVMMYGMPSAPFTMSLLPPMGEKNNGVLSSLKAFSATKYGKPKAEVEREIARRQAPVKKAPVSPQKGVLEAWKEKQVSDGSQKVEAPQSANKNDESWIKIR